MWIIGYPIFDKNIWLFEYLTPTFGTFYSIRPDSDFWLFEYICIRLLSIRSITIFTPLFSNSRPRFWVPPYLNEKSSSARFGFNSICGFSGIWEIQYLDSEFWIPDPEVQDCFRMINDLLTPTRSRSNFFTKEISWGYMGKPKLFNHFNTLCSFSTSGPTKDPYNRQCWIF